MKTQSVKQLRSQAGFSLVEVLMAAAIMVVTISGVLISYLRSMELNEISTISSAAVKEAKSRMEVIKATADFDQILPTYNNVTFNVAGITGKGVSYVDAPNADLRTITITVCWQTKNGRVFGEDDDLDGAMDAGEDSNANAKLDSITQLVSYVYRK